MFLKSISLCNFRNLKTTTITFSKDQNYFIGENAQGKTNLLEAIFFISTGKSFRTNQPSHFICKEEKEFFIKAHFIKDSVEQTLSVRFDGKEKKVAINETTHNQFSSLLGLLPIVLYAPEDLSLVQGAPAVRRRFLNLYIGQLDPLYFKQVFQYHQAMRQRNELLKQKKNKELYPWESAMAHSAHYIMQSRKKAIALLTPLLKKYISFFTTEKDALTVHYQPSIVQDSPKGILAQWQKTVDRDLSFGTTQQGPHRDDLSFGINNNDARFFASQGQLHTLLAATYFSEWESLSIIKKTPILFGIDDFGAHLDSLRKEKILENAKKMGQTFFTSTIPLTRDIAPQTFLVKEGAFSVYDRK